MSIKDTVRKCSSCNKQPLYQLPNGVVVCKVCDMFLITPKKEGE